MSYVYIYTVCLYVFFMYLLWTALVPWIKIDYIHTSRERERERERESERARARLCRCVVHNIVLHRIPWGHCINAVVPCPPFYLCVCVCAALDTTKDPCQKVRCSRHKVCVAQGYQRAMCVNRKKLENRWGPPTLVWRSVPTKRYSSSRMCNASLGIRFLNTKKDLCV